jgi:hypothetical protein
MRFEVTLLLLVDPEEENAILSKCHKLLNNGTMSHPTKHHIL